MGSPKTRKARAVNCRKKKCGHSNQLRPKKKLKQLVPGFGWISAKKHEETSQGKSDDTRSLIFIDDHCLKPIEIMCVDCLVMRVMRLTDFYKKWSSKVSESSGGCKLSLVGLLLAGSSRADARTRGVLKRVLKMERLRIKVGRYLKYLYVDDS